MPRHSVGHLSQTIKRSENCSADALKLAPGDRQVGCYFLQRNHRQPVVAAREKLHIAFFGCLGVQVEIATVGLDKKYLRSGGAELGVGAVQELPGFACAYLKHFSVATGGNRCEGRSAKQKGTYIIGRDLARQREAGDTHLAFGVDDGELEIARHDNRYGGAYRAFAAYYVAAAVGCRSSVIEDIAV